MASVCNFRARLVDMSLEVYLRFELLQNIFVIKWFCNDEFLLTAASWRFNFDPRCLTEVSLFNYKVIGIEVKDFVYETVIRTAKFVHIIFY